VVAFDAGRGGDDALLALAPARFGSIEKGLYKSKILG
jgi:hypothetical protein